MPTADIKDLGVLHSKLEPHCDHVTCLSADCWWLYGAIQRVIRSCEAELLWAAYQAYVQPKIAYVVSV